VFRVSPEKSGKRTSSTKTKTNLDAKGKANLSSNPSFSAGAEAGIERNSENAVEVEETITRCIQQHFSTADGDFGWEVKPTAGVDTYLGGAPWDAQQSPRMKVRLTDQGEANADEPTAIVEIRCVREDIEILDLEHKDAETQSIFRSKKNRDTNLAAAEQLIKDELERCGFLSVADMSEKHSKLLIADKIILEDK
jgi:hypothetical protein